ncbi:MAG: aminomethyltransferase beta-barrel domain-containing protein, partial [Phycisphaerae bacterium]
RLATGHYARLRHDDDGPTLLRAVDRSKDQSYVLFGVRRDVLARTLFPIGHLNKDGVRTEARRLGLPVHDKPESQDICFVPDGDYVGLVRRRRPEAMHAGVIRHVDGRAVGEHDGVATLTIGQRRGVRVALGEPIYVTDLDPNANVVTVGPRAALRAHGLVAREVNWLRPTPSGGAFDADVQIRYHHQAAPARIERCGEDGARVAFNEPVEAVTPGQAAVFYDGDVVIGGGWIDRAL